MALKHYELTVELLKEYIFYSNGKLYRIKKLYKNTPLGIVNETFDKRSGYVSVFMLNKTYFAHRIIFYYHNGYMPEKIDHIDGNKHNNSIENLRPATTQQNAFNCGSKKNVSSKYKGVSLIKKANKYQATIQVNKKSKNLGLFKNERAAALTYLKAAQLVHGIFLNVKTA